MNTKQMDDTKTYMNTSFQDLKIAVAGTGYVGLSIATLLAQKHQIAKKIEKSFNL